MASKIVGFKDEASRQSAIQSGRISSADAAGLPLDNVNPTTPLPSSPLINGKNIGTVGPLVIKTSDPATGASGLDASLQSSNNSLKEQAKIDTQTKLDAEKAQYEKDKTDIGIVSQKIADAPGNIDRSEQDKAKKEVDEYTSQYEAEQLSNRRRLEEMDKTFTGSTAGLAAAKEKINNASLSKQADIAILQNAATRRYSTAADIADRKLELELEPLKAKLDNLKFFYSENKADFTRDEQRQFEDKIKADDRVFNETKANKEANTEMLKGAISAGASAATIKKATDLMNQDADPSQVAAALGVYADYKNNLEIRQLKAKVTEAENVGANTDTIADPSLAGGMGGSILTQTGLSLPAFNFLTQGTAALTKLGADDRKKFMTEAETFLNKKGLDVSTFISRFKAYNDTLTKNISRFNNTQIAEDEILGTIDNLSVAADEKDFGNLKVENVAKLFAGQEVNDPSTLKYQVHLNQLRSELAYYNAAVQGKSQADNQEFLEAERVIKNGLSTRSLTGFHDAIKASVEKMGQVLQSSVDRSNKQVWGLFGLEDKYQSKTQKDAPNPFSSSLLNTGNIINTLGDWQIPK